VLNLGTGEVLVILVVALVVLGPDKLPGAARQAGRALAELRRLSAGFQAELRDAIQEPISDPPRQSSVPPAPTDEPDREPGSG
jgi:sec-independent protein translocase protein TatB